MAITTVLGLVVLGLVVGMVSGMIGIGGGVLVIPLLMFFFSFDQKMATGTSLAMLLPPIGILAVLAYARAGNINWPVAAILAGGFIIGAHFGAVFINKGWINVYAMRITFALFLIYVAANLLFRPGGHARTGLEVTVMIVGFALAYAVMRLLGRRYRDMPHWGEIYRQKLKRTSPYDFDI